MNTFRETAYRHFFEHKIWLRQEYFFRKNQNQNFLLLQKLQVCMHFYSSPHSIWTSPWLDWWNSSCETAIGHFFQRKVWQRHENFFCRQTRSKIPFSHNLPGWVHSYSSAQFIWTNSWLDWRTLFVKLHPDTFLCAKFENDTSEFFVDIPDKKFFLFQSLLRSLHSYTSPHFIWTSPWLDWWTLFVKLHTDTFLSARFDNDRSNFFVKPK